MSDIRVRLVQRGEHEFTYQAEWADDLRGMFQGAKPGAPPAELYDVTDIDRSDADPEEHLTVTDGATVLWSGWLGGVDLPEPGSAADL
ncbi:MAG TPA: hypothetical protein VH478_04315, partial [Trebonia sp.]|nr:hypothetical protein [Trebonia sp.]